MKNWLKKNIFNVCVAFSIFDFVYNIDSFSRFLFGEPEYPIDD